MIGFGFKKHNKKNLKTTKFDKNLLLENLSKKKNISYNSVKSKSSKNIKNINLNSITTFSRNSSKSKNNSKNVSGIKKKDEYDKKKKEVLFSLLPHITKLNEIKQRYHQLLSESQKTINPLNNKKLKYQSGKVPKLNKFSAFEKMKRDLTEKKEELNLTNKKYVKSKTQKFNNLIREGMSRKSSFHSNYSNKSCKEIIFKVLKVPEKVKVLKKIPSQQNLFTPMPELKLYDSKYAEKIKRITKTIRRQEYHVNLKKINITKIFGKKLIFIQRFWRNWFKNVYLKKIIKIQAFYKGHLIRREVKSDKLTLIRFIVKICYNTRKKYFGFFLGQIKKLIRAIFFHNQIDTNDISIQVDIPIYQLIKEKKIEKNKKKEKKEKIKFEGDYEKLSKLFGNGIIIGIKNFPRPYCEIGANLKAFKKKNIKINNQIDVNLSKGYDMNYSGKTSELIIDVIHKKILLNKIKEDEGVARRMNNLTHQGKKVFFNEEKIKNEIEEKNTFLKSKNIKAKEFDLLKSQRYISSINKKVDYQKWNYYTKESYYKSEHVKKRLQLKIKDVIQEKIIIKFGAKIKLFMLLIKEIIILHIRKKVISLLSSMDYRIKKRLQKANHKKTNSYFSLRRSTDNSENSSLRINSNRGIKNNKQDPVINHKESSSVIFNDESIFIYVNNNDLNYDPAKKYQLTPYEIKLYNLQKKNNY